MGDEWARRAAAEARAQVEAWRAARAAERRVIEARLAQARRRGLTSADDLLKSEGRRGITPA